LRRCGPYWYFELKSYIFALWSGSTLYVHEIVRQYEARWLEVEKAGLRWDKRMGQWHVQVRIKGKPVNSYFKPNDMSSGELLRARQAAVRCRETLIAIKDRSILDPDMDVNPLINEIKVGSSRGSGVVVGGGGGVGVGAKMERSSPPTEIDATVESLSGGEMAYEPSEVIAAMEEVSSAAKHGEAGVRWDKTHNWWHVQVMIRGKQVNHRFRPVDLTPSEISRARVPAIKARDALLQIQLLARQEPDLDVEPLIAEVKANKF